MVATLVFAFLALVVAPPRAQAVDPFVVIPTDDVPDANPGDGICDTGQGACSLRAAIMETNALATAGVSTSNVIRLSPGIYPLTIPSRDPVVVIPLLLAAEEDGAAHGDLDVRAGTLQIEALDGAPDNTTVLMEGECRYSVPVEDSSLCARDEDCQAAPSGSCDRFDRILEVDAGAVVSVAGVTFRGGEPSSEVEPDGGAIRNRGILRLDRCRVTESGSFEEGGGISNDAPGTLTISESLIDDDQVFSTHGGGVANHGGDVTISNSIIQGNKCPENGAGVLNVAGTLTIEGSLLTGNAAGGSGGAVRNEGTLRIRNSTLSHNGALYGGALSNADFYDGSEFARSNVTINNTTIVFNAAGSDAGGIDDETEDVRIRLSNSILAANAASVAAADVECTPGSLATGGYNLVGDPTCFVGEEGEASTDIVAADPGLDALKDNGGPTLTHALLPESPAFDRGNPAREGEFICEPTDQRGVRRPGGRACDIGAYEVSCGNGVVDAGEECDDGNVVDGDCCSSSCTREADGSSCADDVFCNGADTCLAGTCSQHAGDPCPGPDGDADCAESCDESEGSCTAPDPEGAACVDGVFCNGLDSCSEGACSVHAGDPCPGPDGDDDCAESCDENLAACTAPDPDGSACTDGLFCTGVDTCAGGLCARHSGDPCPGSDQDGDCAESCNETLGNCTAPDPEGSACTDGLFCDGADTCSGGTCGVHSGDPCPGPDGDDNCAESCDEEDGLCTAPDPSGTACDDDRFCNGNDSCADGACVVHAGDPCPGPDGDADCAESCDEDSRSCTGFDPEGSSCTDGLFCDGTDTCHAGACTVHTGDPCPGPVGDCAETCDEASANCVADPGRQTLTLAEAVARGLVALRSKGCITGDCVALRATNADVAPGLLIRIASGELYVNRTSSAQNVVNLRAQDVCVPQGATVEPDGLLVACIDAQKGVPEVGETFDLGPPLATWAGRFEASASLLRLVRTIDERQAWLAPSVARAIWRVTDMRPLPSDTTGVEDLLVAAEVDPAHPGDDFPHLSNPLAGTDDPRSGLALAPEIGGDAHCLFGLPGGQCDDGDACTAGDACREGSCVSGARVDPAAFCDDGDACTTEGCDARLGCTRAPVAATLPESATCGIQNLEGILERPPGPACAHRCVGKLGRGFARVRAMIFAARTAASARRCTRRLRGALRAATTLRGTIEVLAARKKILPPAERVDDLRNEADRLLGRISALGEMCAAK